MSGTGETNQDDGSTPKLADVVTVCIGVLITCAVLWRFRSDPLLATVFGLTVAVSARLSQIDFDQHRLPNRIVAPLALFNALAVVVLGWVDGDLARAGRALLLGLIVFVVLFVMSLANGIGMGDVKFSFPLVVLLGWLGTESLSFAALVMILTAGLYTVALMVQQRSRRIAVPFGPFMAIGFVVSAIALGVPT